MHKNIIALLLFSLVTHCSIFAQRFDSKPPAFGGQEPAVRSTLSGIVTDAKTNTPLPGATVYIADLKTGAIADSKGYFKITSINSGKYLVEASFQGYASVAETIDINGETSHDFSLTPSFMEQEAVTVTGISYATRMKQNPQSISVIKHDDFLNTTSSNVMDALSRTIPGLSILTTGPAIAKPFIRGLGYNRVVTINDGIRQEGQQWGDEHGIEIDDYSVQKVEVLKGPASLIYGSDAIAGVINIQSQVAAPEGTVRGDIQSEYQTNNGLRGFYANLGGTRKGFSWNAYGDYKGAHDYKNKYDGYVFNSKFFDKDFGGMLGYMGSWGNSRLYLTKFDQHVGIVEGERDTLTGALVKTIPGGAEAIPSPVDFQQINPEVPWQHVQHFKIASDNNLNIGRDHLDLVLAFQRNQRQEFSNPDEADVPNAYFDLKTVNYAARFHLPDQNKLKTIFGVTGMYQTNENRAAEVIIPNYDLFDIGGFVYGQYIKNKWSISGGARVDNRHVVGKSMIVDNEVKFEQFSRNFSNISASVGATYQASKTVSLKWNVARGFRAPNFAELASNGAHEGTNRYETGNKDLQNEVSMQTDVGVEWSTHHISFLASIFYNDISNFIFYEKIPSAAGQDSILTDPETGSQLIAYRYAQHHAHLYGAELHLDIHPHPLDWLHFENTFSYTRGEFNTPIDGSNNIPYIPAARWIAEVKSNFFSKGKTIRNFYSSITTDYTFKQDHPFTGFNTETATDGYLLLDAGIGTDVASKGKTLFSLHLAAVNLADVAYQNHLSRLKYTDLNPVTDRYGVFEMGRNFSIKIDVPISYKL